MDALSVAAAWSSVANTWVNTEKVMLVSAISIRCEMPFDFWHRLKSLSSDGLVCSMAWKHLFKSFMENIANRHMS